MSLKKLSAGDGYTYLIRQVAAHDSTERGYDSLGDYYTEKGESPGRWWGAGLAWLGVSGEVSEAQMRALFGEGRHPDADKIEAALIAQGHSAAAATSATKLGQAYRIREGSTEWQRRLARAYVAHNNGRGVKWDTAIPEGDRAGIRTKVAEQFFADTYGRAPLEDRELSGFLAQESRRTSTAVAGYDCTFSPVKSISALWAIAPAEVRGAIRAAHEAAVDRALGWLEAHAAYTRVGGGGVAQVETRGLLVAVFTHRDSRNGDPQLHTHAAVSNKVQTLDGRWLALDGRVIHELTVAASEFYNTAMEEEFTARLGGSFVDTVSGSGRRPIRELHGIDPRLLELFATRRVELVERREQLAADFHTAHGRQPTPLEMIHLAQRANLETRVSKHQPRSAGDQHRLWRYLAGKALGIKPEQVGAEQARAAGVTLAADPPTQNFANSAGPTLDAAAVEKLVAKQTELVLRLVSRERSVWQWRHVYAEAQRRLRAENLPAPLREELASAVTDRVLESEYSVAVGADLDAGLAVPAGLRRRDGSSVFQRVGGQKYTSQQVLAAERRVLAAAGLGGGRAATQADVAVAVLEWQANDTSRLLNTSQERLAYEMACSGRRVQLALAPAGTGKTTAMGILATAWRNSGGEIVALAPQAAAAQQLSHALGGSKADTLDKLVWELERTAAERRPEWVRSIGPDTLVVIDEAGLASSHNLDIAISYVLGRGGSVRLVGDDRQLAASTAGGLLRNLQAEHGALTLNEVMRFIDKAQGAASLALRAGDATALGYYLDRGRIHATTVDAVADQVFAAAQADLASGADVLMIAPDLQLVAALNERARAVRLEREGIHGRQARISGGETASAGDLVITKRNNRYLPLGGTDFVKNNDRFRIVKVHRDGALTVRHVDRNRTMKLPADYVREHVRLGYAATLRSEQGDTIGSHSQAGIAHVVITDRLGAGELYMGLTRGTGANHAWVITSGDGEEHNVIYPQAQSPATAVEVLTTILRREDPNRSALTELAQAADPALRLGNTAPAYRHAYTTAVLDLTGPDRLAELAERAERAVPGVTSAPAWELLQAHLAGIDLTGVDPIAALADAAACRELGTAEDLAAVLDYRLDPKGTGSIGTGPLPWLPALPAAVSFDPDYGPYLAELATRIRALTQEISTRAGGWSPADAPDWALPYLDRPDLVCQLAIWRAGTATVEADLRPAGPPGDTKAMRGHRARLVERALAVSGVTATDAAARWAVLIEDLDPRITTDQSWPLIASRLNTAEVLGLNVTHLLRVVFQQGPLPAERPADALWWRLAPHLTLTGVEAPMSNYRARPPWTSQLEAVLGEQTAGRILADRLWPAIVSRMDLATRHGADPMRLAGDAAGMLAGHLANLPPAQYATGLLWQLSLLADPEPVRQEWGDETAPILDEQTADRELPADAHLVLDALATGAPVRGDQLELPARPDPADADQEPPTDAHLILDQLTNDTATAGALALVDQLPVDQAPAGEELSPALLAAQAALTDAAAYYTEQTAVSWVPGYLAQRGLRGVAAGYAPAGWTQLVDHLRRRGHTDRALLDAGLAKISRRGSLIDVYRDRVVFPITTPAGDVVSFIGRRNPMFDNDPGIPKYLNGPGTDLYNKSALPYGLDHAAVQAIAAGAPILLVEGPLDHAAIRAAVPLEVAVPIAAAGTALTTRHLQLLAGIGPLAGRKLIAAFDNDPAGRKAAVRAHQLLADAGIPEPLRLNLPAGADPAQAHAEHGPAALADAIATATPLLDLVVDECLDRLTPFHPPASELEHDLNTARALWRTVERSLLTDGRLRPGHELARQARRIAAALDRPIRDVAEALGATAYPDEWTGIHTGHDFDPDFWLYLLQHTGGASFHPYLGEPAPPADVDQVLTWFRAADPHANPTSDDHDQPVSISPQPDLRARYQQALTDYLTARDAYYNQDSHWHTHAHTSIDQLNHHTEQLQPVHDQLQAAQARVEAAHRDGDLTGLATAQQQLHAAKQPLPAKQPPPAEIASDVMASADQIALGELNQLHDQLLQLQAELDQATATEPIDISADQRWKELVAGINPDLVDDPAYTPLAAALDRAHDAGVDITTRIRQLAAEHSSRDAGDLLWRLYDDCEAAIPRIEQHNNAEAPAPEPAAPSEPPEFGLLGQRPEPEGPAF
ncbi:MAG: MobF family relaxase [Jatrophihabitantaceae bacterium]